MGAEQTIKQPAFNTAPPPRDSRKGDGGQVGTALREAYRATVDEAVPDEMLDLLNKLR